MSEADELRARIRADSLRLAEIEKLARAAVTMSDEPAYMMVIADGLTYRDVAEMHGLTAPSIARRVCREFTRRFPEVADAMYRTGYTGMRLTLHLGHMREVHRAGGDWPKWLADRT